MLTISRWLHRRLNVANTLDGDAVLIVAIHKLVFELANLVDEHAELVRDIRDIIVTCLAPE
jgi:putative hemolysin